MNLKFNESKWLCNFFAYSIIVFISIGCSEAPPKWMSEEFDEKDLVFSKINIREVQVNGVNVYSDLGILEQEFGPILDSIASYEFTWENHYKRKRGEPYDSIYFVNYSFDEVSVNRCKGVAKISLVRLYDTDLLVNTVYGNLSSKTRLSDIKSQAKKSYDFRNIGGSIFSQGYGPFTKQDYDNGKVVRMIFEGDELGMQDEMEMIFYKKKLAYILFSGIDLEYDRF